MTGRALRTFLGVGSMIVVAGALWLHRARTGPLPSDGTLVVPGLSAPVTLFRDPFHIPHLWAETPRDAFFAQGFVTAGERLWQMEMFRRVAEGRLSEVFGETTLETDRFLRTLGMAPAAARQAEALDPGAREMVQAYVAGVNAAIDGWRGPLPPEFVLLRARPEPWTVEQALAIEKVMAWDLAEYQSGLLLLGAARALGPELLEEVRDRYPPWGPTIVEGWPEGGREAWLDPPGAPAAVFSSEAAPGGSPHPGPTRLAGLARTALPPERAAAFLGSLATATASNSWVVGPERSRSGKPLLANDMHLSLDAPTIWYLVGLHAPGLDVVGMSLPGTFGVAAGHTSAVAWGFTNAVVDDADFFVERVDPADSTRYLTPGGSESFRVRREVIRVKGRAEPDTLVVRITRHGPVMTPVEARAGGDLLALRWAAHDVSGTPAAILALNTATSVDDVIAALERFDDPHQNVVFADTTGRWGYWMAGRVPLRRSGAPPLLPVPGWTGEHDWVGELPFEEHPHALEPEEGFVVTANNMQTRGAVGALITDHTWEEPYRAIRIRELIEGRPLHDARSMLAIQMDVGSAFVRRYLPFGVAAFRKAERPDLADRLERWDGAATVQSREATLFHAWFDALRQGMVRRLYGERGGFLSTSAVERALVEGRVSEGEVEAAAREAAVHADTPWGDANLLTVDHPLAGVRVLGTLFDFGRRDLRRAGGPHSPNVSPHGGSAPPFRVRSGPSQRHVVDLGDLDGAGGFVIPGGQSGWPGSPHAWDQLDLWQEGELVLLPLTRWRVESGAVLRRRLVPTG